MGAEWISKMDKTRFRSEAATEEIPCIWAQAGVVPEKPCKADYDCTKCRFDRAMRRAAEENQKIKMKGGVPAGQRGKIVPWQERLKEFPPWKKPCIHSMKGRIEFRACNRDYHCGSCEFDQYFQDQFAVHAAVTPVDILDVVGFKVPQGYYFHPGHTWAKIEGGGSVRVGLDDFVLRLLGPLERIEAPLMGKPVEQGRDDIRIRRGDKHAALVSPVSGVVTAVNPSVREQGGMAGQDPFSEGWVMTVHATELRRDIQGLMIGAESMAFMEGQVERLYRAIEESGGPLAVDGGQLGNDIYGAMPELGWDRLVNLFLKA